MPLASKILFVVCDGLGDRPVEQLGNLTPLEKAHTPNLDQLASAGITGRAIIVSRGFAPGSDVGHLTLFGYDYKEWYNGRGPFEVAGIGMDLLPGDIAFRGNLATVDEAGVVVDRRAGRLRDVAPFVKDIDGLTSEGVTFHVKPGTAHRAGVIMRGAGLSSAISDTDAHEAGLKLGKAEPLDNSTEAVRTCKILNAFLDQTTRILRDLPLNRERASKGLPPANALLLRGAGTHREFPNFKSRYGLKPACVAGGGLYKGVARTLGFDVVNVPGANALPDTDLDAKIKAVNNCIRNGYSFIFLHIKAADSLGEDGNHVGKMQFIERVDRAFSGLEKPDDLLIVVTADHSTPCSMKLHSSDPVPILISGPGVLVDSVTQFGERACVAGGLGLMHGLELMPELINVLGHTKLVGA